HCPRRKVRRCARDTRHLVADWSPSASMTQVVQTASHWGVYHVSTDGRGRILGSAPSERDPNPSALIHGLPELVHDRLRIRQPFVREGFLRARGRSRQARGAEPFVPIGWDQALDLVATEIRRVKAEFGNEAIYGGSYGWASAGRFHHSPSVL